MPAHNPAFGLPKALAPVFFPIYFAGCRQYKAGILNSQTAPHTGK